MAEKFRPPNLPERNPITGQTHKREVFWQIYLPAIIGGILLLLIAAGVLIATYRGTARLDTWAAVSEIILVVPAMLATVIFAALAVGSIYLVTRLLGIAPGYARLVQDFFTLVRVRVRKAADASAEPFLRINSFGASLRALGRKRK
jgi:hypothetical protein